MSTTFTRLFNKLAETSTAVAELALIGVPHRDISLVASTAGQLYAVFTADGNDCYEDVSDAARTAAVVAGTGSFGELGSRAISGSGPVVAARRLTSRAADVSAGADAVGAKGGLIAALKSAGANRASALLIKAAAVRRGLAAREPYLERAAYRASKIGDRVSWRNAQNATA